MMRRKQHEEIMAKLHEMSLSQARTDERVQHLEKLYDRVLGNGHDGLVVQADRNEQQVQALSQQLQDMDARRLRHIRMMWIAVAGLSAEVVRKLHMDELINVFQRWL